MSVRDIFNLCTNCLRQQEQREQLEEPKDVLTEHRRKNRHRRPPNPERLADHAHTQRELVNRNTVGGIQASTGRQQQTHAPEAAEENPDGEAGEEEPNEANDQQGLQQSEKHRGKPHQLQFYAGAPGWTNALSTAKKSMRLYTVVHVPFATKRSKADVREATFCLDDAIRDHEAEGGYLEPGILSISLISFHAGLTGALMQDITQDTKRVWPNL